MPNITDYRPIIILSPVIKFLEGFIIAALRHYAKYSLNKRQFGFVPRVSI